MAFVNLRMPSSGFPSSHSVLASAKLKISHYPCLHDNIYTAAYRDVLFSSIISEKVCLLGLSSDSLSVSMLAASPDVSCIIPPFPIIDVDIVLDSMEGVWLCMWHSLFDFSCCHDNFAKLQLDERAVTTCTCSGDSRKASKIGANRS